MEWTYNADPRDPRDQVRINVGDVREDRPLIPDTLIDGWLELRSNDPNQASLDAIDFLIADAMRDVSYSVDGASVQLREYLDNLRRRRTDLLAQTPLDTSVMAVNDSQSAMDAADLDSDRPKPAFTRDMMEYPGRITNDQTVDSRWWWGWR